MRFLSACFCILLMTHAFCFAAAEGGVSVDRAQTHRGYFLPESAARQEYARALEYGFVAGELADADPDSTAVTWKQYCRMIAAFVQRQDASAAAWEAEAALALECDEPMTRDQACFALYRAFEIMDLANIDANTLAVTTNPHSIETIQAFDDFSWNYVPFTGDGERAEWVFEDADGPYGVRAYWNTMTMFCHHRISLVTGATLFDPHIRLNQPLTLRAAALSLVRGYESQPSAAAAELLRLSERFRAEVGNYEEAFEIADRRARILSSDTAIVKSETYLPGETYTGNAYYVSNGGDDRNDGLSPERAWSSLNRVLEQPLRFGDAVFFERGGIWRGCLPIWGSEGITVSAYGDGAKPILTTSPENGASAEKWTLFSDQASGGKIWKFYRELPDCGAVVLDDRTACCKATPVWSGSEWQNDDGSPFDVRAGLAQDLDFFSDNSALFLGTTEFADYPPDTKPQHGALYLRCDAGNPGEIFESIEFAAMGEIPFSGNSSNVVVQLLDHSALDNISIKYYPMGGAHNINDSVVQNCEFAWGGGCIQYMREGRVAGRMGDALAGAWQENCTVRQNYFHDLFSGAMIVEGDVSHGDGKPAKNIALRAIWS